MLYSRGRWQGEARMDMQAALAACGVRPDTLSEAEKTQLERDGYLPLADILTMEQVHQLGARADELVAEEGEAAGLEVHQEAGADRLSDLINKDARYDVCFTHPRVLAAIWHVLGADFRLSSLNFRAALPGSGLQPLHADWREAVAPGEYQVCNSIWLLDEFSAENGATRVVPGSQRSGMTAQEALEDAKAPHPEERLLLAPAGTVVIFNSHTWHGGTHNRSGKRRRALHSYFCRREQQQQLDQQRYLRETTWRRLSPAARYLLDVRG